MLNKRASRGVGPFWVRREDIVAKKSRPRDKGVDCPISIWDISKELGLCSKEDLIELLMMAGERYDALKRVILIKWAGHYLQQTGDFEKVEKILLHVLTLEETVTYDQSGPYDMVAFAIIDFFNQMLKLKKTNLWAKEFLNTILPVLEESSMCLMDEESWFEAHEQLRDVLGKLQFGGEVHE